MIKRKNIAVFGSGTGSNAQNLIAHFKKSALAEVKCVVTNKENAGILNVAEESGVKSIKIDPNFMVGDIDLLDMLKSEAIDVIVLAGFLKKIPTRLTQAYPNRIFNIHPALLPKFGGKGMYGSHVHQAVYDAKEDESGITIHYVNSEYDEGAIIFQASVAINENESASDIEEKVRRLEKEHFPQQIEKIIRNGI